MQNSQLIRNFTINKIFFCGIGGVSMSALAAFSKKMGYTVMGSDSAPRPETIKFCKEQKIPLFFSHDENNLQDCDTFVYTSAISPDNPELIRALKFGLRVFKRSQFLGLIADSFSTSVAVAGTHGKSTTTHLIYELFRSQGIEPFLLAGALSKSTNSSFNFGQSDVIVYEACEYDRSFLDFNPKISVILNIEREHTDVYPTLNQAINAYYKFASKSQTVVLSCDSPACLTLARRLLKTGKKIIFFSLKNISKGICFLNVTEQNGFFKFDIAQNQNVIIKNATLGIPGIHNLSNAAAAVSALIASGYTTYSNISKGLSAFKGIKRRFEYLGSYNGAHVYDDYAHHPSEIKATLKVAKSLGYNKIICAFQPHTYSRTHDFFNEFTKAFTDCDEVIFTEIFAARENNVYGISSLDLANATENGKFISDFKDLTQYLAKKSQKGVLILTMGAGKLDEVANALVNMEKSSQ